MFEYVTFNSPRRHSFKCSLRCFGSDCFKFLSKLFSPVTILSDDAVLITLLMSLMDCTKGKDCSMASNIPLVILETSLFDPEERMTSWENMAAVRWGYLVTTALSERVGCSADNLAKSCSTAPASKKFRICLNLNFKSSDCQFSVSCKFES